jgi:cytochrome c biogenesis protein CcmG/thiol:disulfide interchange protein DsbE
VLLLASCSDKFTSVHASQGNLAATRKMAADFTLQDANGNPVKLSDFRGKVVLLNFWATWCGPCALEIPWFIEFEQQFRAQGLEVVGVSMDDEGWKVVKPYIQEHKLNYRVVMGTDSVGQLYGGVDSLPTTFLIDRYGKIAKVHVGLAGKNEYRDEIEALLGEGRKNITSVGVPFVPATLVARTAE